MPSPSAHMISVVIQYRAIFSGYRFSSFWNFSITALPSLRPTSHAALVGTISGSREYIFRPVGRTSSRPRVTIPAGPAGMKLPSIPASNESISLEPRIRAAISSTLARNALISGSFRVNFTLNLPMAASCPQKSSPLRNSLMIFRETRSSSATISPPVMP